MTQVDPGIMERGFLAAPDSLPPFQACLLTDVKRIVYFKGSVKSKHLFHISIGQDTLLARITCLRRIRKSLNTEEDFEYEYAEEFTDEGTVFSIAYCFGFLLCLKAFRIWLILFSRCYMECINLSVFVKPSFSGFWKFAATFEINRVQSMLLTV